MEGTRRSSTGAAVLLAATYALAGCCHGTPSGTSARLNRDTPERAFEFVRAAFAEDRTEDQFDSFHPDFVAEQGISASKYQIARSLSPSTFRRASALLGAARLDGEPEYLVATGPKGERMHAVRLRLVTPEGQGVFLLQDRPKWEVWSSDPDLPSVEGGAAEIDGAVRLDGDRLKVAVDLPLPFPPAPGSRIQRFTIHHDWLLWHVESLQGFEELLGEVKATDEKAKEAPK